MQRQASSARLTIAAIAGGLVFIAFVALTSGAGITFSPVLFVALAVALAVAAFLLSGFHKSGPQDRASARVPDEGQTSSDAWEGEPGQKSEAASFDSGSTPIEQEAPDLPTAETPPDPIVSDRAEGPLEPPAASSVVAEPQEARPEHVVDEHAPTTDLAGDEDGAALRAETDEVTETEESGLTVPASDPTDPASDPTDPDVDESGVVGHPPGRLDSPREAGADDLKRLRGVGPKLEEELNAMGIYHLDQIAGWTPEELAWVDANLPGFKGRASRDDWVTQARELIEQDG